MPELPDIEVYAECLRRRLLHQPIQRIAVRSPFLLRTFDPTPDDLVGSRPTEISRSGKRLVIRLAPNPSSPPRPPPVSTPPDAASDSVASRSRPVSSRPVSQPLAISPPATSPDPGNPANHSDAHDAAFSDPHDASALFLVIHLMIAGRLQWRPPDNPARSRIDLAALSFQTGTLILTEASKEKRAGLWILRGRPDLDALLAPTSAALDPLSCPAEHFAAALAAARRTLKRALTDPALISGIGNAYSDEILHAARLSPFKITTSLTPAEIARLHAAMRAVLQRWITGLRREFGLDATLPDASPSHASAPLGRFPGPGQITAFRKGFAVHGRFGQPCPSCGTRVQRIVRAAHEFNYCPTCQTGGKVLADRALSRLLKDDWPETPEEWERDHSPKR